MQKKKSFNEHYVLDICCVSSFRGDQGELRWQAEALVCALWERLRGVAFNHRGVKGELVMRVELFMWRYKFSRNGN